MPVVEFNEDDIEGSFCAILPGRLGPNRVIEINGDEENRELVIIGDSTVIKAPLNRGQVAKALKGTRIQNN